MNRKNNNFLWPVNISEDNNRRYLHFGTPWIQGSMIINKPFMLDLDYIKRMMVWLLFADLNSINTYHTAQLGLGAGSLTKFCYKYLKTLNIAIEINPEVIKACQFWFKLPTDSNLIKVVESDAQKWLLQKENINTIDAMQVDLFDSEAASPVLDSLEFYQACHNVLTEKGIISINLFGNDYSFEQSWYKIVSVFGKECCYKFYPTKDGNTIVFASKKPLDLTDPMLEQKANLIKQKWQLPAPQWLSIINKI